MIAWGMLSQQVRKLPEQLVQKVNESELYVLIGNGSRIDIKGADNPDSLRGVTLNGAVLDEYADMKPHVFDEILSPALRRNKGFAYFIGTPKGFNHFYDLYYEAQNWEGWSTYRFTSYDNPHLPEEEIESERKRLQARNELDRFEQEYMAEFRKYSGLVYKAFDRSRHIYNDHWHRPKIDRVMCAIDWGYTNPTAVLKAEIAHDGTIYISEEWYRTHKTTAETIEYLKSIRPEATFPDPAEPDRSEELMNAGLNPREVNKDIQLGIDAVQERFKEGTLLIHESCKNLIAELETYHYKEDKDEPEKEFDHACDALRYLCVMNRTVEPAESEKFSLYAYNY